MTQPLTPEQLAWLDANHPSPSGAPYPGSIPAPDPIDAMPPAPPQPAIPPERLLGGTAAPVVPAASAPVPAPMMAPPQSIAEYERDHPPPASPPVDVASTTEPAISPPVPAAAYTMRTLTGTPADDLPAKKPAAVTVPTARDPRDAIVQGQIGRLDEQRAIEAQRSLDARARAVEEADAAADLRGELEQREVVRKAQRAQEETDARAKATKADELAMQAAQEVDPDKFWQDRGGFPAKVLGAIAVGLGELGSVLAGTGRNTAADMINRGIEQSIRTQETNRDAKGKAADRMSRAADSAMSNSRANDEQFMRDHIIALEDAKRRTAEIAARYGTKEAESNGQQIMLGLTEKQDQIRDQLKLQKYTEAKAASAAAAAAARQAEQRQWDRGVQLEELAIKKQNANTDATKAAGTAEQVGSQVMIPTPDGKTATFTAGTKEAAGKVRESAAAWADLRGTLAQMRKIREEYGSETGLDTEVKARALGLAANAQMKLKDLQKLGALSGDDYKALNSQVPKDPTELMSTDAGVFSSIDTAVGLADTSFQNMLTVNARPGTPVPAITSEQRAAQSTVRTVKAPGSK